MDLPMIQATLPARSTAEVRQVQQAAARQRALQGAEEIGCDLDTFAAFPHVGSSDVLFTCARNGEKVILKARIGDGSEFRQWPEASVAAFASNAGVGALSIPITNTPAVMASKFLEGEPLDGYTLRHSDLEVVGRAHQLHASSYADVPDAVPVQTIDLFRSPLQRLTQVQTDRCLTQPMADGLRQKLSWLQNEYGLMSFQKSIINGDIHPGNLIRDNDMLYFIDWGAARWADPLFDLVRMSFTLRTPNSRLLKYLEQYTALSGQSPTVQEQHRILVQQAVNNIAWYLNWLRDAGADSYITRGMVTRLLDDEIFLPQMPRIDAQAEELQQWVPYAEPQNIAQARHLAEHFAGDMMAPGAKITTPLKQKSRFSFFRIDVGERSWFAKIHHTAPKAALWREPQWTAWAANEGLAPQMHPASGSRAYANLLLTDWSSGEHLDRQTANDPVVRRSVLRKLRQLHQRPAPIELMPAQPMSEPLYQGGAWGRIKDLEDRDQQTPLPTRSLRTLLGRVIDELRATPSQQTVCHRDTHPRNMFFHRHEAIFVDWDFAGWDDPLRDVARFFVLGYTPLSDVRGGLEEYLGHAPSDDQLRRLKLIMLATEIDFYGANQADVEPTHRAVTERAERIGLLTSMLNIGK